MKNGRSIPDTIDLNDVTVDVYAAGRGTGNGGHGNDGHGNGGNSGGEGSGGGTEKGVLYGDQITLYRDLDLTDGGGNGEPILDDFNVTSQLIAVGYDPLGDIRPDDSDGLFPIYFDMVAEDDYEIPPELLPYVQAVELERANVARAPERVMEKALDAAVTSLLSADLIQTDAAGRLMYSLDDGATFLTIDAPLENLALYQALMTAGNSGTWIGVQEDWDQIRVGEGFTDLSFLSGVEGFDPSALIAAAWSKEGVITLDALIYENTTLGVNEATIENGEATVDYFDFTDGTTETYDYVRSDRYDDTWLRWIEIDPGTGQPVFVYGTVYDAVFDSVEWGADEDTYLAIETNGTADLGDDDFVYVSAENAGVNDFAQAADDSRAVIEFIHANQAVEIAFDLVPDDFLFV